MDPPTNAKSQKYQSLNIARLPLWKQHLTQKSKKNIYFVNLIFQKWGHDGLTACIHLQRGFLVYIVSLSENFTFVAQSCPKLHCVVLCNSC